MDYHVFGSVADHMTATCREVDDLRTRRRVAEAELSAATDDLATAWRDMLVCEAFLLHYRDDLQMPFEVRDKVEDMLCGVKLRKQGGAV